MNEKQRAKLIDVITNLMALDLYVRPSTGSSMGHITCAILLNEVLSLSKEEMEALWAEAAKKLEQEKREAVAIALHKLMSQPTSTAIN